MFFITVDHPQASQHPPLASYGPTAHFWVQPPTFFDLSLIFNHFQLSFLFFIIFNHLQLQPIVYEHLNTSRSVQTRFRDCPPIFTSFQVIFDYFRLFWLFSIIFKPFLFISEPSSSYISYLYLSPIVIATYHPFLKLTSHFRLFSTFYIIFISFLLIFNHSQPLLTLFNPSQSSITTRQWLPLTFSTNTGIYSATPQTTSSRIQPDP